MSRLYNLDSTGLKLFGTSGIRGRLGRSITTDLAYKMGLCLGSYLGNRGNVLVGYDLRPQSGLLYSKFIEGLTDSGLNAILSGKVPTPMLLHCQLELHTDCAVMVTGSHTVPGVTGLLFFKADGGESDLEMELDLERLYFNGSFSLASKKGAKETVDASKVYFERILHLMGKKVQGYKIAFDAGNGSMSEIATELLTQAGATVYPLNDKPDGTFPNRSPYPRKETLKELSQVVKQRRVDFGVGTDGDGDRAIFADESGKVLMGDVSGALFVDHILRLKTGSIVAPLNSSNLIRFVCDKHKARLMVTKVGPPAIVSSIRQNKDAVFGLEETGKYIWPEILLYGDSVYSTSKMCELLDRGSGSLGILVSQLPKYYMEKKMVRSGNISKETVMQKVHQACKLRFVPAKITTWDGVKVDLPDGSWILLRPSGTEPYFRCYAESFTRKGARQLAAAGMEILRTSLNELIVPPP